MDAALNASLVERIRSEVHRRLEAQGRVDDSDLDVKLEASAIVLEGSVDDAFAKALVESVAREIASPARVTSRISVRVDLGAEAEAKRTEFGTRAAARAAMTSIPRPQD